MSVTGWSTLVVMTKGTVAVAPGTIAPENATVKPVTGVHDASGAGSVSTVDVVCGSPGLPSQSYVMVADVAPVGHPMPLPAGEPVDV
jgi:hypothetical protein